MAFRFYNPEEVVAGKPMREQLRFALSYWHTLCGDGTDMFGRGTFVKDFGAKEPDGHLQNKAYAAFELMEKLDIDFFCFHDRDIAPEGETLAESNANLDVITDLAESLMKQERQKAPLGHCQLLQQPPLHARRGHRAQRRRLCLCRRADQKSGGNHHPAGRPGLCVLGRPRGVRNPAQYRHGAGAGQHGPACCA